MNKTYKKYLVHLSLFILTFLCATLAGGWWIHGKLWPFTPYSWEDFTEGLYYSVPFLLILTVHEFGHYFTARYHKVKTTLPYYIPIPPFPLSLGTMGALIRIKEFVKSRKQNFDIGLAGPLAGFVVAIAVIFYGFTHLPDPEYIFEIHPEYETYGLDYAEHVYENDSVINVTMGTNLTFMFFERFVVEDKARIPNPHEMMHYPYLFAGFLALLFTAINLLPIGQLDGGHILYGLVGLKWHKRVATAMFLLIVLYAGLGYITPYDGKDTLVYSIPLFVGFLFFTLKGLRKSNQETLMLALVIFTIQFLMPMVNHTVRGYPEWLLFVFIIGRVIGVYHPPAVAEEKLDLKRQVLGWLSLIIFIISFSPRPLLLG